MIWVLILAVVAAAPFVVEVFRKPMGDAARKAAPGQFANLSRGTVHYQWHGPKDGPVLVCIHGLTTPSFVWTGLVPYLTAQGFRVLTYDLYGRGYSDRPLGRQDSDFFRTQLEELLAHEGVTGAATLVGYSMGGAIAAAYTAKHPDKVTQLVLLAPAGMGHDLGPVAKLTRSAPFLGSWIMHALFPRAHRAGSERERVLPSSVPNIVDMQQEQLAFRGYLRSVHASLRGILGRPQEREHKEISKAKMNVVAIWGGVDSTIPISCKDRLAEWNPGARHEVLWNAGHGLVYTDTEGLANVMLPLLDVG